MNKEQLSNDFFDLHFRYAKELYKLVDAISQSGEDGVLYYLYRDKEVLHAGDLVERLGLTSGRVANILMSLEKKDYIVRKRDENDKRKTVVLLTKTGNDYIIHTIHMCEKMCMNLTENIGEQDMMDYMRIAEKIFFEIRNQ